LAERTELANGTLSLNAEELRALLLADDDFEDVEVDVVRPGEDVRILHVVDVVEPRTRASAPGTDFPGMLGTPRTVGDGCTNRLNGLAVTEVGEPVPGEPTYWREAIIDMAGEGSKYSPFSQLLHVVLTFRAPVARFSSQSAKPAKNIIGGTAEALSYTRAIKRAGLKAAVYIANATAGLKPDSVDFYSLHPPRNGDLPKIAYLFQASSPYVYGEIASWEMASSASVSGGSAQLPTIIHPNEVLDGALVNGWAASACIREPTYVHQNHPIIHDLYRRDGIELDFRGVVLYGYANSVEGKERLSSYASNLAAFLAADGAILSYLGSGHPIVEVMMICEKLESAGMKTVVLLPEMAANPRDSGHVYFVRQADAIVSTGNYEQIIDLPKVSRVLGGTHILETGENAFGPLRLTVRHFVSSTDHLGSATLRGWEY
jgi:sarcosine reductase